MKGFRWAGLLPVALLACPKPLPAAIGQVAEGSDFLGTLFYGVGLGCVALQALIPLTLGLILAAGAFSRLVKKRSLPPRECDLR